MKEFMKIMFIVEMDESYTRTQKAVNMYVVLSVCLMFITACCGCIGAVIIALCNLANALRLGYKYIPDFDKGE